MLFLFSVIFWNIINLALMFLFMYIIYWIMANMFVNTLIQLTRDVKASKFNMYALRIGVCFLWIVFISIFSKGLMLLIWVIIGCTVITKSITQENAIKSLEEARKQFPKKFKDK